MVYDTVHVPWDGSQTVAHKGVFTPEEERTQTDWVVKSLG